MKKVIIMFFALILPIIIVACGSSTEDSSEGERLTGPTYSVQIEIDCVENLFFSKYDVDVFVDESKLEKLDHGTAHTYSLELEAGAHTLTVTKTGNKKVDGVVEFTVSKDENFYYKIACTSQQVKVEEIVAGASVEMDALKDTSRNLSGFDTLTNQSITFCGIDFSFPAYFDVLESETASDDYVHYYPEEKNYSCSLIFSANDTELSQSEFDDRKSAIADSIMAQHKNKVDVNSASTVVAGLSGWSMSYITTDYENPAAVNLSFIFNPENQKIIMVFVLFDSVDMSNYDYAGDYYKMIQSAEINTRPVEIDSIYDIAYVRELNEYSLYYLFDMDNKIVRYFSTNDTGVQLGTISGEMNSGMKMYIDYGDGFSETLKYKTAHNDSIAILTDSSGFEWEYKKTDVAAAEAIIKQPGYSDIGSQNLSPDVNKEASLQPSQKVENKKSEEKKDELREHEAKRAFEYYGEYMYPYGFECHWFTKLHEHTQLDDGSWKFKVGVTITNQYGASREAVAEALINNTTKSVENFDVYAE